LLLLISKAKVKGRWGQFGTQAGKNLIMSIFVKDTINAVNAIFTLNIAVALAIYKALETANIPISRLNGLTT
jgi:BirA family biotin operon repressor/biotin-[acetyl-CoA-carboxylase] ligase